MSCRIIQAHSASIAFQHSGTPLFFFLSLPLLTAAGGGAGCWRHCGAGGYYQGIRYRVTCRHSACLACQCLDSFSDKLPHISSAPPCLSAPVLLRISDESVRAEDGVDPDLCVQRITAGLEQTQARLVFRKKVCIRLGFDGEARGRVKLVNMTRSVVNMMHRGVDNWRFGVECLCAVPYLTSQLEPVKLSIDVEGLSSLICRLSNLQHFQAI